MKIKWKLSDKRPFKVGDKAILDYNMENNLLVGFSDFKNIYQTFTVTRVSGQKSRRGKKIPKNEQEQYLTFAELKETVGYPAKYFVHPTDQDEN